MSFSGDLDGEYIVTVKCPDKDYVLHWKGYADYPIDALSHASTARLEERGDDEDG